MTSDIDAMQSQLRTALRAASHRRLITRPASGDWSIMENLRHLLSVEQLHFRHLYTVRWSPLGWNRRKSPDMEAVGAARPKSVEEVLDEWARVHRSTRRALQGRGDEHVREALYRNWRHLRNHKRIIDGMLRQPRHK